MTFEFPENENGHRLQNERQLNIATNNSKHRAKHARLCACKEDVVDDGDDGSKPPNSNKKNLINTRQSIYIIHITQHRHRRLHTIFINTKTEYTLCVTSRRQQTTIGRQRVCECGKEKEGIKRIRTAHIIFITSFIAFHACI